MFLLSAVTRSTLTAGPSSISYRVTVRPAGEPGDLGVHFELLQHLGQGGHYRVVGLVPDLGTDPGRGSTAGGSVQLPSASAGQH